MIKNSHRIKVIGITVVCSMSLLVFAEALKMTNQVGTAIAKQMSAHAGVAHGAKNKDQPLWTKAQQKQAELEEKYKQAIANDPDNKKNYAYLAGVYLANNKSAKAIDAYQEAIMHDPENPKLFAALSIAYLHQSKFGMAKAMADQALTIDPSLKSVNKINEYIVAKKAAIDAASNVPAGGKIPDMSRFSQGAGHAKKKTHGALMSMGVTGEKPADTLHNPIKTTAH